MLNFQTYSQSLGSKHSKPNIEGVHQGEQEEECCQEVGPSLGSDRRSKPEAGHPALRQVTGLRLCHRLIRKLGPSFQ